MPVECGHGRDFSLPENVVTAMSNLTVRLQNGGTAGPTEDGRRSPRLSSAVLEQPASRTVGRVTYKRTRIVPVAPDVLQRRRVAALSGDANADAFRLLRTQLLLEMRQNGWQTLAVTSPNKGAGKSTVSLNLAITFAMELDCTALLVDADLREPDVRPMLGLPEGPGLADYLLGKAALEDLLVHPGIGNLVILPGSVEMSNSAELLRSPMMTDLIEELRQRYPDRIVLFDVPPILSGADTLALSTSMDAVVLLVEDRKTSKEDVERACSLLRHANLIGMVLNKSRELPEPDPILRRKPGLWRRFLFAEE